MLPGTRFGSYEVVGPLGAGGMGEVYRARDLKLARDVALKTLPPQFTCHVDRLARFQREARVLASLNHPNIAQIYGFEERPGSVDQPGGHALIMELVEGPTLAEWITKRHADAPDGRLSDTIAIARQIADALEAAHDQGVVHRDLKPANVKVREDGTVKVLDFGLAKAVPPEASAGAADAMNSPTITNAGTQLGVILGTAAYMSPEQAKGKPVDRRADIWAFGVVIIEMLTARRMFTGDDVSDTLAAVLRQEVDWAALPSATPPALKRLLARCLERDPRRRLRDIGEARVVLEDLAAGRSSDASGASAASALQPRSRTRERAWMAVAGLGVAAAAALGGWIWTRPAPEVPRAVRFPLQAPETETFFSGPGLMSLSPDGRQIAFVTGTTIGDSKLWLHSLETLETRQIPGTTGAWNPFWSPSGRFVGFVDRSTQGLGKLKRADLLGKQVLTLADAGPNRGSWSAAGIILFAARDRRIYRVADTGGDAKAVTDLDEPGGEIAHDSPVFLPDGRRFVFQARNRDPAKSAIYLASLDPGPRVRLVDVQSNVDVASGHLLYHRDGTLFAQPFDVQRGVMTGDPRLVLEGIMQNALTGAGAFSASDNGALVYRLGAGIGRENVLTWFDRTGKALGVVGGRARNELPRISPDGKFVAVPRVDQRGASDLFLIDVERDVTNRITFDPANDRQPVWSHDGQSIVFTARRGAGTADDLIRLNAVGAGAEEVLFSSPDAKGPFGFSSDGKFLLFGRSLGAKKGEDIWALPLTGDRTPFQVVATPFRDQGATFSPDNKWVAYYTQDADGPQVYVIPFPPTAQRVRLSTTSGYWPQWSADGKRIIYVTEDWHFMEVGVSVVNGTMQPSKPRELFVQVQDTPGWHSFAFDPVKERFLLPVAEARPPAPEPLMVVLNWRADLSKR